MENKEQKNEKNLQDREKEANNNIQNFIAEFKNLFANLFNNISTENKKFLSNSLIEDFKSKFLTTNFTDLLTEEIKSELGKIFLENYFLFKTEDNLESYLILLIDILPIIFSMYSQKDLYYIDKLKENKENKIINSILNENLIIEKYFIFLGNDIEKLEDNKDFNNFLIKPDFVKIEELLNTIKTANSYVENYNLILDLIFILIIRNSDIKYLSIHIANLDNLIGLNPIVSFKIIIYQCLIYVNLPCNQKNFNILLGNSIKFILSEANSLSRRMNELLYDDKFTDFEYNIETKSKKINLEEFNFLRVNFFPLLNFIFKIYLTNKNQIDNKDTQFIYNFYFSLFSDKDFLINPKNVNFLHIINFDSNQVMKRIYKRLEKYVEENEDNENEDTIKENNNNNTSKEFNQNLDHKINYSYNLLAFVCDITEFIYSKFHIMPESFGENSILKVDLDPFVAYEDKYKPLFFLEFLRTEKIFFNNCITNISNFIKFSVFHNEFKNKHQEKIKKLTEESDDIYNLLQPFNTLGLNIFIWICWKTSTNFSSKEKQNINTNLNLDKTKKFINLCYSKVKIFDSILPVSAFLLKSSQNFKYMAFELLFDCLDIIELGSIRDLHMLKNYSYDDIYLDLLEFVGGPDPAKKRQKVAKEFNKLLYILSDEVKKKLILFILNENLKPNKFINDQMNAFILHSLRNLLNDILKKKEEKESELFEEKFLKEIISLSVTTKVFVIDIFEVICQGQNFIQFCILSDKKSFKGSLNICNKDYLNVLEKENERVLYFVNKWNNEGDEQKMKQVTIDTSDINTVTDAAEKRKELMGDFDKRKNQGLITQGLIAHINDFVFKCKKELN